MKGQLDFRNWEESASKAMGHVWMTDCDSLYEHLMSQRLDAIESKRLAIDLMALCQQIWERDGERTLEVDHSCGDYPRWNPLIQTLMTGRFDMRPTAESLMIKEKNRAARKKGKSNRSSATTD